MAESSSTKKAALLARRAKLLDELTGIDQKLAVLEKMERPFVARIETISGSHGMEFKYEKQARDKFNEYCKRTHYRKEAIYGAYLYKQESDGTKTLLEHHAVFVPNFYPTSFNKKGKRLTVIKPAQQDIAKGGRTHD